MNLISYIERQADWSAKTFGEGARTEGLCKHIESELAEIRATPILEEWVDVMILALDGAWRSGHTAQEIVDALERKQTVNFRRRWGPADTGGDEPTFHVKETS